MLGLIMGLVSCTVAEVTDGQAWADGFAGSEDVLPALREYYPDLQATDAIAIVSFDLDPS